MVSPMRRVAVLLALLAAPTVSHAQTTVAILVRHAEKAGPTGDVPLSPAGVARAQRLATLARQAGVDAAIATQFLRTKQTVEPLGLPPTIIEAGSDATAHAAAVATAIKGHGGHTVLVVGHSNTIPAIVAALGGPTLANICDSTYDRLFVVVLDRGAFKSFVESRYGDPSPADPSCAP